MLDVVVAAHGCGSVHGGFTGLGLVRRGEQTAITAGGREWVSLCGVGGSVGKRVDCQKIVGEVGATSDGSRTRSEKDERSCRKRWGFKGQVPSYDTDKGRSELPIKNRLTPALHLVQDLGTHEVH